MKAINKSLIAAVLTAPMLTGCIEESVPTSTILATQLEGNTNTITAFAAAMPSQMNTISVSADQHYDFGMPAQLHMRDVMTEDMAVRYAGGYDWFASFARNSVALGEDYMVCQVSWNYYYAQILTTNNTIKVCNPESENPAERYYLGAAKAFRAGIYLDAARMYEVLPTAVNSGYSVDGNYIIGLTLPIVNELTTEEEMTNNPRASHADMFAFIVKDLEEAIPLMEGYARPAKTQPNVAVAKGLLARAYLWDATFQEEINGDNAAAATSYQKAAQYAREAINASGATPLTRAQWHSTTAGFNDLNTSSWMWGGQYSAEDDVVVAGGIRTWTSFCSNEQHFGYAAPAQGAFSEVGASFYNRVNDLDWRKLSWVAPEGSALSGQEIYLDDAFAAEYFDGPYISLKFRPGQGEMNDPNVGAVVGFPLMRVEEMYLIEAEATAHVNPGQGRSLIESFINTYRYTPYSVNASTDKALINEIVLQKRIELWGEGRSFFDVKRLNMNVTRWYEGTNFTEGASTFNTVGRPAWMNFVIVSQEINNNQALKGYNTPSPAGLYDAYSGND